MNRRSSGMLEAGAIAPSVELKGLDGRDWSLRDALRERPVLLVFFKISCPTCQFTLPFVDRLARRASHGSVVLISQDDASATAEFHEHFGIAIPTVLDPEPAYSTSSAYGVTNVPSLFLIERDGAISLATAGFHKADLESAAARLCGGGMAAPLFEPGERVPAMRPG